MQTSLLSIVAICSQFLDNNMVIQKLPAAKGNGSFEKQCLKGTRVNLLSQIETWALDPKGNRTLLLYGAAGNGKSSVVNSIVKALRHGNLAVVPFFAYNCTIQELALFQLIPSWAQMLAQHYPDYFAHLHAIDRRDMLQSTDIDVQYENLWENGLASIAEGLPVVFTIDALDECPEPEALFALLEKLVATPNLPPFVRFLFTFRPDGNIRKTIHQLAGHSVFLINIDDEEHTHIDIHKFIESRLVNNFRIEEKINAVSSAEASLNALSISQLIDYVVLAAESSFQCADVLCSELTPRLYHEKSTKQYVELVLALKNRRISSLYETYKQILGLHLNNGELRELFCRVMSWVLVVHSPQPLSVFHDFAGVLLNTRQQHDVDLIMQCLPSLLSGLESNDMPITLLHTSFHDFLVNSEGGDQYHVDVGPHVQEELTWACLKIMNNKLQFNICHLPPMMAMNDDIQDLGCRVKQYISSALQYACCEIAYHIQVTGTFASSNEQQSKTGQKTMSMIMNIQMELVEFLNQKFLYWLEAHSCMKTRQGGPGAILVKLYTWAVVSKQYDVLAHRLNAFRLWNTRNSVSL